MAESSSNVDQDLSPQREAASSNPRRTTNRVRTRGITRTTWSIQEKEIMFACFTYSRSERWGRNKARVFQDQLRKSSLNQEKLESMTTAKLNSLMSQIGKYLSNDKQAEIKAKSIKDSR